MFETAGKNKIALMLAPMSLAIGLAAGSVQAEGSPALTNSSGEGVLTGYGECWGAVGGATDAQPCVPAAKAVIDTDGDGVPDDKDRCPNTPKGAAVDAEGCPLDTDGDGVPDYKDKCPGTPAGAKVDGNGCEIAANVTITTTADHFAFDSAELKPAMTAVLDEIANKVKASPGFETVDVVGHTDSTGPEAYNQALSERRAQAAADYLSGMGIEIGNISGMGESSPAADNGTREGRAMNRRVEIITR
jgi:OOP family OmpA-OmpF porin